MNIEEFRDYCISLKGVTEGFPFDNKTLVFKVMNKMFALTSIEGFKSVNLKCDPELAIELREQFMAVQPGYHMNKKHWNTVTVNEDVLDSKIIELTQMSYDLVVSGLTKKLKLELENL
jgi:predicted DNA-binding protein (MmcQ/YjbR family)